MKNILVIGDPHAHPKHNNTRADWIGEYIADTKPDEVICIGDLACLPSLCSHDAASRKAIGRNYKQDIESACEFNDRMFHRVKRRKRKKPKFVILEGNHERRIERMLDAHPYLEGQISFKDLQYDVYYDEVIRYNGGTPGIYSSNGVDFAHYFVSGAMGRAISGEHSAYSLVSKRHVSSVCGHSHVFDYCQKARGSNGLLMSVVAGHCMDYPSDWAGQSEDVWWSGLVHLRSVDDGQFDVETISMNRLKKTYNKRWSYE